MLLLLALTKSVYVGCVLGEQIANEEQCGGWRRERAVMRKDLAGRELTWIGRTYLGTTASPIDASSFEAGVQAFSSRSPVLLGLVRRQEPHSSQQAATHRTAAMPAGCRVILAAGG